MAKIDMKKIEEIIKEASAAAAKTKQQSVIDDVDDLIKRLEKAAGVKTAEEQPDASTLEAERQVIKKQLLRALQSDNPSPTIRRLREALVRGNASENEKLIDGIAQLILKRCS